MFNFRMMVNFESIVQLEQTIREKSFATLHHMLKTVLYLTDLWELFIININILFTTMTLMSKDRANIFSRELL